MSDENQTRYFALHYMLYWDAHCWREITEDQSLKIAGNPRVMQSDRFQRLAAEASELKSTPSTFADSMELLRIKSVEDLVRFCRSGDIEIVRVEGLPSAWPATKTPPPEHADVVQMKARIRDLKAKLSGTEDAMNILCRSYRDEIRDLRRALGTDLPRMSLAWEHLPCITTGANLPRPSGGFPAQALAVPRQDIGVRSGR
jgi:hypothetical protein